jgi:MoaA/NifB/PqqE/SkfB family radical SAM enzyme
MVSIKSSCSALIKKILSKNNISNRQDKSFDYEIYEREAFKQAVVSYPPPSVTIGVNSHCMNRCAFCAYHSKDAKNKSRVYNVPFMVSPKRFKQMVDMCHQGGVPNIHLCATGEPFLHPQINELLEIMLNSCGYLSFQSSFPIAIMKRNNSLERIFEWAPHIRKITTDIMSGDPAQHAEIKIGSDYYAILDILKRLSDLGVSLESHFVLTKLNYTHIEALAATLINRDIKCTLAIVNIHPYGFNELTDIRNAYYSVDLEITRVLERVTSQCFGSCVNVSVPTPFDTARVCGSLWSRFQVWPVDITPENRRDENIVIGGCSAVVLGDMHLGYFFDYSSIMELWNNPYFVAYRTKMLNGEYPSMYCVNCSNGFYCINERKLVCGDNDVSLAAEL